MTPSAPTYNTHQFQVLFLVVRNVLYAHVSANRENHKNYNSSGSLLEPHLRAQMWSMTQAVMRLGTIISLVLQINYLAIVLRNTKWQLPKMHHNINDDDDDDTLHPYKHILTGSTQVMCQYQHHYPCACACAWSIKVWISLSHTMSELNDVDEHWLQSAW